MPDFHVNTGTLRMVGIAGDFYTERKDFITEETDWYLRSSNTLMRPEMVPFVEQMLAKVSVSRFTMVTKSLSAVGEHLTAATESDGILTSIQRNPSTTVVAAEVRVRDGDSDSTISSRLGAAGFLLAKADVADQVEELEDLVTELEPLAYRASLAAQEVKA